jgi:hypothetical protein
MLVLPGVLLVTTLRSCVYRSLVGPSCSWGNPLMDWQLAVNISQSVSLNGARVESEVLCEVGQYITYLRMAQLRQQPPHCQIYMNTKRTQMCQAYSEFVCSIALRF